MKFKVENMHCQKCANTIKNALSDEFGEIKTDLENKIVSVKIKEDDVQKFQNEMSDLGFEAIKTDE
ncbi:heavy-metal-associated domain-containing protein [Campylobacter hominis]|uniref:Conserved domain protein n=1 Tax=Campylobacter hominis (strain ATCC BAA-381 / DSM 21671 / CCUG 45161 / LMG 19568 / NCTC 13146 / CH001A) TaxID=360107 RepID=A7I376_CAMHC|nr:heavy metal-associated domain-containing protein [Campylobacter hominis]ABS51991.1 conserved domain protein [Campylobacter hominis ATCC BAA-381]UAK85809.1 heavy-metal-associated domain-containing protein [Campylobacter hominis]SUW85473.1 asparagine synthase, glutamine-hydrolyzing [Campylobacter hominis]